MLKLLVCTGLMFSSLSFAMDEADHVMMKPQEIKWGDAPPSLPAGAKAAVLYGDPTAAGPFGMRLKIPAKYKIAPHFHPQDENVTIISGTFMMGTGDDAKGKMMSLEPGSFARMKAGTHHFARADKEAIVQINGIGPWGITYVNPADDPRNKK
jgi:quercetin dioxygenase-like cupin family protein